MLRSGRPGRILPTGQFSLSPMERNLAPVEGTRTVETGCCRSRARRVLAP